MPKNILLHNRIKRKQLQKLKRINLEKFVGISILHLETTGNKAHTHFPKF
jgi:hypothetical protein